MCTIACMIYELLLSLHEFYYLMIQLKRLYTYALKAWCGGLRHLPLHLFAFVQSMVDHIACQCNHDAWLWGLWIGACEMIIDMIRPGALADMGELPCIVFCTMSLCNAWWISSGTSGGSLLAIMRVANVILPYLGYYMWPSLSSSRLVARHDTILYITTAISRVMSTCVCAYSWAPQGIR